MRIVTMMEQQQSKKKKPYASPKPCVISYHTAKVFLQKSMTIVVCLGLGMVVQASSTALAAETGEGYNFSSFIGYQTAEYSYGDASMSVSGIYLGAGSHFSNWLEVEVSLGYTVGNADELDSALVSDLETLNLNLVLKPVYRIDNFSIYGKAGLNYSTIYYSVGWGSWSTTGFGGVLGGGASYNFDNGFGVHAELLSYIGTDSVEYDGPSNNPSQGGDIDYSSEFRIGVSLSF